MNLITELSHCIFSVGYIAYEEKVMCESDTKFQRAAKFRELVKNCCDKIMILQEVIRPEMEFLNGIFSRGFWA
jgi:hypothetical protein